MEEEVASAPIAAALHEQEHALVAKRARAKSEHEAIEANEKNRSRNDPLESERPGEVLMRSPKEQGQSQEWNGRFHFRLWSTE